MFGSSLLFGATAPELSFDFGASFTTTVDPVVDVSPGAIDVTFPSIIDIINSNATPVTENDSVTTTEGAAATIDVLANDFDPEGDTIALLAAGNPTYGTVSIENGEVIYTPEDDFSGTDSFTYTNFDGLNFAVATVDVVVEADEPMDGPGGVRAGQRSRLMSPFTGRWFQRHL